MREKEREGTVNIGCCCGCYFDQSSHKLLIIQRVSRAVGRNYGESILDFLGTMSGLLVFGQRTDHSEGEQIYIGQGMLRPWNRRRSRWDFRIRWSAFHWRDAHPESTRPPAGVSIFKNIMYIIIIHVCTVSQLLIFILLSCNGNQIRPIDVGGNIVMPYVCIWCVHSIDRFFSFSVINKIKSKIVPRRIWWHDDDGWDRRERSTRSRRRQQQWRRRRSQRRWTATTRAAIVEYCCTSDNA